MGRRKEVTLHLNTGRAYFVTGGTDMVKELPFDQAKLVVQGDGFDIHINLMKLQVGIFTADSVIKYDEEIKHWR